MDPWVAACECSRPQEGVVYFCWGDGVSEPSGETTHYLQQTYRGVPVLNAVRRARIGPRTGIDARGRPVEIPADLSIDPELDAVDATVRAIHDVEREQGRRRRRPTLLCSFSLPSRPAALHVAGMRGAVRASLVIAVDVDQPHLAWHVRWDSREGGSWESLVHATDPDNAVRTTRVRYHARATGEVFEIDPSVARNAVDLPLPADSYPWFSGRWRSSGPDEPREWVARSATSGNNAGTYRGARPSTLDAVRVGSDLVFQVPHEDRYSLDQCRLNAFFVCNWLHDLFWTLGFTEERGTFQKENFDSRANDRDPFRIEIYDESSAIPAGVIVARDGYSPRMELLRDPSGRHVALDAHVVIHEFTHAVTDRVIGGPHTSRVFGNTFEGQALNEGFSDYFAMSLVNHHPSLDRERTAFAPWAAGDVDGPGYRPFRYDGTLDLRYADVASATAGDPHDLGQLWCQLLLDVERVIDSACSEAERGASAWRLVFQTLDAFELCGAPLTLIDAKAAFSRAFRAGHWTPERLNEHGTVVSEVFACFDHYGFPYDGDIP